MWLLDWLSARPLPEPRSYEEIRAIAEVHIEERDAAYIQRLNRAEEALLLLTAEAGLEDLRRRLEEIRR